MRRSLDRTSETRRGSRGSTSSPASLATPGAVAAPRGRAGVRPQIAPNSFPLPLDPVGPCRLESCLRRARGAGRTKPPEEHYAEAERSSGRWTKAFPARRIFAAGPFGPGRSLFRPTRACTSQRSSTLCEKKTSQFATCSRSSALTHRSRAPSVRLAPSTEHRRLKVSPRGSRFGGGQSEDRTKVSPARCIFFALPSRSRCSASADHRARRSLKTAAPRRLSRVRNRLESTGGSRPCRLLSTSAICAKFVLDALDPGAPACIEWRCTEYGASEVDGSPSGSRFGGGQSESRTKAPPARCIFFVSQLGAPRVRSTEREDPEGARFAGAVARQRPAARSSPQQRRFRGRCRASRPAARFEQACVSSKTCDGSSFSSPR